MCISCFFILFFVFCLVMLSLNAVYAVFFFLVLLVLLVFILITLNCTFFAFIYLIVYIGAILVFFLFLLLVFDLTGTYSYNYKSSKVSVRRKEISLMIGLVFLISFLLTVTYMFFYDLRFINNMFSFISFQYYDFKYILNFTVNTNLLTLIAYNLYIEYMVIFLFLGFMLLIALICAISIVLFNREFLLNTIDFPDFTKLVSYFDIYLLNVFETFFSLDSNFIYFFEGCEKDKLDLHLEYVIEKLRAAKHDSVIISSN